MKKLLYLIVSALMAVCCAVAFTACGTPGQESETLTKQQYVKVLSSVSLCYEAYVDSIDQSSGIKTQAAIADTDFVDADSRSQLNITDACMWMIRFLKNVCNNETFVLTEGSQSCYIKDTSNYEYRVKFDMSYAAHSKTVLVRMYCEQDGKTPYVYDLNFEIDYDFDTDTLNEFSVLGVMGQQGELTDKNVNFYKFKNNNLKYLSHDASGFMSFATNAIAATDAYAPTSWGENLADYSVEYNSAAPSYN